MQHEWNPCSSSRLPSGDVEQPEFAPASKVLIEQLKELMGEVTPNNGMWTQRDVEGLLSRSTRLQDRLRMLLIELAPACPQVVASDIPSEVTALRLNQMLYDLKIECNVHPESFTDEPMFATKSASILAFTSEVTLKELMGAEGIIEKFGFWPATLRETMSVFHQRPDLLKLGDVMVCGSIGRRANNYYPHFCGSTTQPTLKWTNDTFRVRPNKHFVVAFAKDV